MSNPRGTAATAGHPVHQMLIPFPMAFFVAAFICDLAFWATSNPAFATGSIWLIGAGVIACAVVPVAGLAEAFGDRRIRGLNDACWQAGVHVVVVLIGSYNWYIRYSAEIAAVIPEGVILSFVAVCLLLFTGWKGWQMAHGSAR